MASESTGREPSCPPFAGVYAGVRGSSRRRSQLSHPAVHGSSRRRSRLTLAHQPAADSMPASDSMPAGKPIHHSRSITPPSAAHRPRRSREITPPSVGKANPPSAAPSSSPFAGKANPPSAVHSAHSQLRLPPARGPLPLSGQASRLLPLLSSQPVMVSPAGRGRIWPDCVVWPVVSSLFRPGGLLIPPSCPMDFFWGGTKVPAVEAGPRDEATATMDHLPWPPELPAPPWPSSVCSALEAPSCVCLCVGPEGSPECPAPSLVVLLRRGTRLPGGGSYGIPLSCVFCVPASCFLIWLVSCPRFMSLWVNSCLGVRLWLCLLPCVFKSCLLSSISCGLLVTPGVSVSLPCLVLPWCRH